GLGTSYGRGGATTFSMDLKNADSILIMGSNMAECHPVAFRWVMQAKTRDKKTHRVPGTNETIDINPCKVIHADPRFTRTSAMADIYAPVRAGSDIVFLGALIRHVLRHYDTILNKQASERTRRDRFFLDYLFHYTNAATLITEEFRDTEFRGEGETLESGLFSGFDSGKR